MEFLVGTSTSSRDVADTTNKIIAVHTNHMKPLKLRNSPLQY